MTPATSRRTFLEGALGAAAAGAVAPAAARAAGEPPPAPFRWEDGHLVATSDTLEVVFDGRSGGIRAVTNRVTGQALLQEPTRPPQAFRMRAQELYADVLSWNWEIVPGSPPPPENMPPEGFPRFRPGPATITIEPGGAAAALAWPSGQGGIELRVRATFSDTGDLELWPAVSNDRGRVPPQLLWYPILPGLAPLSPGGAEDHLIYPQTTAGYLYDRPLEQRVPAVSEVYPDGYFGNAMQVMGYYAEGTGGYALEVHDPHNTRKFLHFRRGEMAVAHESWDMSRGSAMDLGYPVVLAPLVRGDWHEVAEHYRTWALRQPWCERGPNHAKADGEFARWLYEEVGIVVWGAPSNFDWSPWYRYYAEVAGTKIQVVCGYDWQATRPWQKGFEGYFPARFHPENVKAWEGHYVTPYMQDLFVSQTAQDFRGTWLPSAIAPARPPAHPFPLAPAIGTSLPNPRRVTGGTRDWSLYGEVMWFMCPTTEPQKQLHTWRDRTLLEEAPFLAGIQYDISFGNCENWMTCRNTRHGHPPGAGRWIIDHYYENARDSKRAMDEALGRYAVQGTETLVESALDVVDCYFTRITAGPQSQLEGRSPATLKTYELPPGEGIAVVPFFDAVYHDHAPVRQDGYARLDASFGEIFYWVAARTVLLFGGLLDLDYNVRWPEAFPGWDGEQPAAFAPYDDAYWTTTDLHPVDEGKAGFARQVAQARTTFGNPWLAYGRLARPTGTPSPGNVTLDFAAGDDWVPPIPPRPGTWDVPQLFEAAWLDKDDRVGLFFVNLHADHDLPLAVDVDAAERWGVDARGRAITAVTLDGSTPLGTVGPDNRVRFSATLPPRVVTMVAV